MRKVINKLKKSCAITVYIFYLLALIVFITFGTEIATTVKGWITNVMYFNAIDDVTLSLDTSEILMAGKTYSISYRPKGNIPKFGAGLRFQSLNPEYLNVSSAGALFVPCDFEGEEISLSYKITSNYDPSFEKVIHLNFMKVYPSDFSVKYRSMGLDVDSPTLYEGVSVFVYVDIPRTVKYGVTDYELLYDERYFERTDKDELTPIQGTPNGETTSISIRYANGDMRSSTEFSIVTKAESPTACDEIQFTKSDVFEDTLTYAVGEKITPVAHFENEEMQSAITLRFEEGDGGKAVAKDALFSYSTPGEKTLKVYLPSGVCNTYKIQVLHITKFPAVDLKLNSDGAVEMLDTDVFVYKLHFDSDVTFRELTFIYDESMVNVYQASGSLYIDPNACGETTFVMILDDGVQHFEKTYRVIITEDLNFGAYALKNLERFLTKIMGHFALFAGLGVVTMFLFRFIPENKKLQYFILFLVIAFAAGLITEGLQLLIPNRSGKFRDVLLDTAGYVVGALITDFLDWKRRRRIIKQLEEFGYPQRDARRK